MNTDRILCSESLKEHIPITQLAEVPVSDHVTISLFIINSKNQAIQHLPFVGLMLSVLVDSVTKKYELTIRAELEDALEMLQRRDEFVITQISIIHGERTIAIDGSFSVAALSIESVETKTQMCTISLCLMQPNNCRTL